MTNHFKLDHEEILIFLEDNISKLVRLKVASKAKYEAYDDSYMSTSQPTALTMKNVSLSIRSRHNGATSPCWRSWKAPFMRIQT